MALSEGDKNTCKELAREIIAEVLKDHIKICPYGRSMHKFVWVSIGIAIGSGIAGGGLVLGFVKALGVL